MIDIVVPALILLFALGSLIDIITRPDSAIRYLPKVAWILLVIILPVIGGILWFVVGRSYETAPVNGGGRYAEPLHRGDPAALRTDVTSARVRTTEQELEALEREAEFYKRQALLKKQQDEAQ